MKSSSAIAVVIFKQLTTKEIKTFKRSEWVKSVKKMLAVNRLEDYISAEDILDEIKVLCKEWKTRQ